jgi:putative ABC transport system permease protein
MNNQNDIARFWSFKLLRLFCPDHLYEEIEGDLIQKFNNEIKSSHHPEWSANYRVRKAKRRLMWNALRFFRPGILMRNKFSNKLNQAYMIKDNFRSAFRNIEKRKFYSFINTAGLTLGITSFLFISLFVWHERSYDQFHVNKANIYRLQEDIYNHGILEEQIAGVGAAVGQDLKDNLPEVSRYVRLRRNQVMLSYGEVMFKEERVFFASEDFFNVFTFPLLQGNASTVLKEPFTMVVSEKFARKYFGDEDPVGKVMRNNGAEEYKITGVFKDVPENTHLQVDALFSFNSLYSIFGPQGIQYLTSWGWVGYPTYIELKPGVDPKEFESKMARGIELKIGEELARADQKIVFHLQPLTSIHLSSHFNHEVSANGDQSTVDFLSIIAVLILAMSWINYISLTTARSMERSKEVGIRKVLGSNRTQLVRQFLVESFVFNFIAFAVSFLLVILLLPYFSILVNRQFDLSMFTTVKVFELSFLLFTFGVVCSGVYPALVISGYAPIKVLKGRFQPSSGGALLRKGLVLTQFVVSIVLICGTYVIFQQLQFVQSSPLGVDIEQMLVVQGPTVSDSTYNQKFARFRNQLLSYPEVKEVTASSAVPGRGSRNGSGSVRLVNQDETNINSIDVIYVDEDFVTTYGLQLKTGRTFSKDFNDHGKSVLLNEAAVNLLGFSEPEKLVNEKILVYGDTLFIAGVLSNYHQQSLKKKVEPLIFACDRGAATFYSIKIKSRSAISSIVEKTETEFKKDFTGNPFNYFFLDDYYNEQYKSDQQFGQLFGLFTTIGILIACLGLFGLSSYLVLQRTKEIGIRKVLGASIRQIAILVSKDFILIVLLANLIAWPVAYWVMNGWLNNFAYRMELGVLIFIVPGVSALFLALITVSSQSIKAALINPIDNLRSE